MTCTACKSRRPQSRHCRHLHRHPDPSQLRQKYAQWQSHRERSQSQRRAESDSAESESKVGRPAHTGASITGEMKRAGAAVKRPFPAIRTDRSPLGTRAGSGSAGPDCTLSSPGQSALSFAQSQQRMPTHRAVRRSRPSQRADGCVVMATLCLCACDV